MGSALFRAICRTGIFMICAQAIVHFRPQESYEKYLKLLVSVMVLLQLFLPLVSFLTGIGSDRAVLQLDDIRKSLEQSMDEGRQRAAETDALLEQMTLEEVRRRMAEQAAQQGGAQEGVASEQAGDLSEHQAGQGTTSPGGQQSDSVSVEVEDIKVEISPVDWSGE